jgi:signal transduction histidine kinase
MDPMRTTHAQDRSNNSRNNSDPNGANVASATGGTFYTGSVVEHRGVVGEFATRAVAALPFADGADEAASPDAFSRLKPQPQSEIFTKVANVKSRIIWTPERRKLLQEMWDRGEKASAIATALGCKVGAINVARARLGLKARRIVSGRPKQEPHEPAHKIERVAFTTSRLAEYCSEKELVAQTGHEAHAWLRVIIKELVDNSIDACEEAEVAPVIKVAITTGKRGKPTRIVVADNGPGISARDHHRHHRL